MFLHWHFNIDVIETGDISPISGKKRVGYIIFMFLKTSAWFTDISGQEYVRLSGSFIITVQTQRWSSLHGHITFPLETRVASISSEKISFKVYSISSAWNSLTNVQVILFSSMSGLPSNWGMGEPVTAISDTFSSTSSTGCFDLSSSDISLPVACSATITSRCAACSAASSAASSATSSATSSAASSAAALRSAAHLSLRLRREGLARGPREMRHLVGRKRCLSKPYAKVDMGFVIFGIEVEAGIKSWLPKAHKLHDKGINLSQASHFGWPSLFLKLAARLVFLANLSLLASATPFTIGQ